MLYFKKALFTPEKVDIGLFYAAEATITPFISIASRGPTPLSFPAKL
jgi:hypothetical protein